MMCVFNTWRSLSYRVDSLILPRETEEKLVHDSTSWTVISIPGNVEPWSGLCILSHVIASDKCIFEPSW